MTWPHPTSEATPPNVPPHSSIPTHIFWFPLFPWPCHAFAHALVSLWNAFLASLSLLNSQSAFKTDVQCLFLQESFPEATVASLGPHACLSLSVFYHCLQGTKPSMYGPACTN